jgi:uncharacterized membrane protein
MSPRPLALGALAFLGMVDTLYLSLTRDTGPAVCHVTEGCGDVLSSAYSEIGGVPISWFGFAFYVFVFGLTVFEVSGNARTIRWLRWPSLAALIVSAVLVGIQAWVLEAWCEYCLGSATFSTLIFLTVWTSPRSEPANLME